MVVIPLAGNSSRFFNAGYDQYKFLLPLGDKTILEHIVSYVPDHIKVAFILRKDHKILDELKSLFCGRANTEFVEINKTKGQLDTVIKGLLSLRVKESDQIIVYNGDTIRKINFDFRNRGKVWLEVFEGEGDHWSFVDRIGEVGRITEKQRISNYCSNGLYSLGTWQSLKKYVRDYAPNDDMELFIAPFMNYLLTQGVLVRSYQCEKEELIFAGTPDEYEQAKLLFGCADSME